MSQFFDFIFSSINDVYNLLDSYAFDVYGLSVSIAEILIGFLILNMFLLLFWRGAKG